MPGECPYEGIVVRAAPARHERRGRRLSALPADRRTGRRSGAQNRNRQINQLTSAHIHDMKPNIITILFSLHPYFKLKW